MSQQQLNTIAIRTLCCNKNEFITEMDFYLIKTVYCNYKLKLNG